MGANVDWDALLPGEADWDALLPNHQWTPRIGTSWEHVIPPPRRQLDILPENFGGSCGIHSFSETLTGVLRIGMSQSTVEVDLPRLLHLTAAKGILTEEGSTMTWMNDFAKNYGIPLDGQIAEHHKGRQDFGLGELDFDYGDLYALNTPIFSLQAQPMPFSRRSRTVEAAVEAIKYRETLCNLLDLTPLVICLAVDDRFDKPRQAGQPYCRVEDSWMPRTKIGHCVTAYGYRCPGGDVRTLRVLYQENSTANPNEQPGRLVIHPDAIDSYHVVRVNRGFRFSNTPAPGYQLVEKLHPKPSLWKRIIG